MTAYLQGLSTTLPPFCLTQTEVRDRAELIFGGRYPQFDRLAKTFDTAGIDKRYSVVPIDWFSENHGWVDRTRAYLDGAKAMFISAAHGALTDAEWQAQDVDFVVTVTSTGIATPTLEAQVLTDMGFRSDIIRVPMFGLGCAGGVSGLSIAATLARGRPSPKVYWSWLRPVRFRFALIGSRKRISSQRFCLATGRRQHVCLANRRAAKRRFHLGTDSRKPGLTPWT